MPDFKVNFKELKAHVGVTDVAYALGYRLDRKAGVGRYIELVLSDGREKRDTIIVSHPNDRAAQTFFRRDGSKGDVLTLIRENLDAFLVTGKDEWQKVAKVMARFANMPEPEYNDDREYVKSVRAASAFDASRYEVRSVNPDKIPPLLQDAACPMTRSGCSHRSFPSYVTSGTGILTATTSAFPIPMQTAW